jgi:hypothetical protein
MLYESNIECITILAKLEYLSINHCKTFNHNYDYIKNIIKLKYLRFTNDINDQDIENIDVEFIVPNNNITINGLNKNIKKLESNGPIKDEDL